MRAPPDYHNKQIIRLLRVHYFRAHANPFGPAPDRAGDSTSADRMPKISYCSFVRAADLPVSEVIS